jgi:hypothetical protein
MAPPNRGAKLTLDENGLFRVIYSDGTIRYPEVELRANSIKVGCIRVSYEACSALFNRILKGDIGFLQAEWGLEPPKLD